MVPLNYAYLHVAKRLAKQMRACYAPWDPYKLNKIDPKPAVLESMPCGMVRTTESADTGLRAATDAPSSRPSTLPEAPEPPGALSYECKAVNRREWRSPRAHGRARSERALLGDTRSPEGDPGRVRTASDRTCTQLASTAAPALIPAREGAIPAMTGVGAEGIGRRGERPFDGKAVAHAGEPRRI